VPDLQCDLFSLILFFVLTPRVFSQRFLICIFHFTLCALRVCVLVHSQESLRAAAEARASIRHETPTERPPSVITFHASVSRTFGRSARLLDVDLEACTVVQVRARVCENMLRAVMACFSSFFNTSAHSVGSLLERSFYLPTLRIFTHTPMCTLDSLPPSHTHLRSYARPHAHASRWKGSSAKWCTATSS